MPRSLGIVTGLLLTLAALGLLWQWLSWQDLLSVQTLQILVQGSLAWRDNSWAIIVVMAVYAGASLVMFPLSILVALTGLMFGPLWGFGYALAGTLGASILTYWVGRRLGRDVLLRHGGRHLKGLSRYLAGRGIRTMTVVSLLPLAPFTLTNMLAGAFHLRFRDYMLGSLIGILPGLAAVTLLSSQFGELITAENRQELMWSLGGIVAGIALLYGLKRYADRRRRERLSRRGE